MNALSVYNVSKSVKDENLFSNVSFGLEMGEHLGIIGKNGAGKSTFLNLIAGKLEPDEGEITINSSCRIGFLEQPNRRLKGVRGETIIRIQKGNEIRLKFVRPVKTDIARRARAAMRTCKKLETIICGTGGTKDLATLV